jgi:hypothetical protein
MTSRACQILEERKILDSFVPPDVSWDPKGPRLAALIETVQLRPATVMLIDDKSSQSRRSQDVDPGPATRE